MHGKSRKQSHIRRAKTHDYEAESNRTLIDLDNNGSIDEQELKQLLTSIHSDDQLCSEDFVRDLMARVKNVQKEVDANDESLEFTFEELMLSILKRPKVDYTKSQVLEAFATLSGTESTHGHINTEKLTRAIQYGNGGITKSEAEDIMSMLEHTPTATFDYVELCDLLMGHSEVKKDERRAVIRDKNATALLDQAEASRRRRSSHKVSFTVPKHILEHSNRPNADGSSASGTSSASASCTNSPKKPKGKGVSGGGGRIQLKKSVNNIKRTQQLKTIVSMNEMDTEQPHSHSSGKADTHKTHYTKHTQETQHSNNNSNSGHHYVPKGKKGNNGTKLPAL